MKMKLIASAVALQLALMSPVLAQDAATDVTPDVNAAAAEATPDVNETALSISLNALDTTQNGCKLTFVIENDMPETIDSLRAEVALFDPDGVIDRLTMLDFMSLPAGKTRVRQFELPGEGCDQIGGLLLNDIKTCEAGGADCMANLVTSSKAGVDFGG